MIDLWGLGYDLAERMDLLDEIRHIGYHVREMRIVNEEGRPVAGFGSGAFSELAGGRNVTLQRSDLSRLLFAKLDGQIESIFSDTIVSLRAE